MMSYENQRLIDAPLGFAEVGVPNRPILAESSMFWAKTTEDGRPGISVLNHCLNVGAVSEAILSRAHERVRSLLPHGSSTMAALHDIGKITLGFQIKCPHWILRENLPKFGEDKKGLWVGDHALISQIFLRKRLNKEARLWSVAVGAHHGEHKGRNPKIPSRWIEGAAEWFEGYRVVTASALLEVFGPLPTVGPAAEFSQNHSDLWLLAGLISFSDWVGSNERWFPPDRGLSVEDARKRAQLALDEIGWPGGRLLKTGFSEAFGASSSKPFVPNALQEAVAASAPMARLMVVEGPMGCGKTEAALFAAQQMIGSGENAGLYFALPTQVTSNRIHLRVENFLRNSLESAASLRLAHGNAWLEDSFDLELRPTIRTSEDATEVGENLREARSWFASPKQALLAPYGVGTVDQALQAVVTVKHFFVRRFALAGKVVILDEVHSYDVYTGTLITQLIRELLNLQCSVIVLSATLTAARRRELLAAGGFSEPEAPADYPLITSGDVSGACRHVLSDVQSQKHVTLRTGAISEEETIDELIRRAESGQHVLWIRNTVIEAQDAYRMISGNLREGAVRLGLLHSRFPFHRRAELEDEWLERLGKNRSEDLGSILVATQVVEQSVDIDLDFIVSDLAPTDMLLQRVGRLWRHQRNSRQASEPSFWVRIPKFEKDDPALDLKRAFGRSARVYAPYVLLRSAEVWGAKSTLALPQDIRDLLEETYAESGVNDSPGGRELHQELEQEKAHLAVIAEAATRVLGRPALQDSEEVLTRRKGPPTVALLLIRSLTTGPERDFVLESLQGDRISVSESEDDWRRSAARFIHTWTVRVPKWRLPQNLTPPNWLRLHGPKGCLVAKLAGDGSCIFENGSSPMQYTADLGIFSKPAGRTVSESQRSDDDEFDY
jgi:CRISPR-associated endonuclease/helicase Cas3